MSEYTGLDARRSRTARARGVARATGSTRTWRRSPSCSTRSPGRLEGRLERAGPLAGALRLGARRDARRRGRARDRLHVAAGARPVRAVAARSPSPTASLLFVAPQPRTTRSHDLDVDRESFLGWVAHARADARLPVPGRAVAARAPRRPAARVPGDGRGPDRARRGRRPAVAARPRRGWSSDFREGGLAALVQTREQREIMDRVQAAMAVIEGYAEHVMDALGAAAAAQATKACARRWSAAARAGPRPSACSAPARPRHEDAPVRARASASATPWSSRRGRRARSNRVWESPESLPTLAELDAPGCLAAPRAGHGLSLPQSRVPCVPPVTARRRAGLQTCVRWYTSTVLRTNKVRLEHTRSSGKESEQHTHGSRRPPPSERPPPSKAAATRKRNAASAEREGHHHAAPSAPPPAGADAATQTLEAVAAQAERVVLIPVGAALVARDTVRRGRQALHHEPRRPPSGVRAPEPSDRPAQVRASRHHRPQPRPARGQADPHPRRARAASAPQPGRAPGRSATAARPSVRSRPTRRDVERQVKTARRERREARSTASRSRSPAWCRRTTFPPPRLERPGPG